MIIKNMTKIPKKFIARLVGHAAREIDIVEWKVGLITIKRGRGRGISGIAFGGGSIEIVMVDHLYARCFGLTDALCVSERFYEVLLHELAHLRDYAYGHMRLLKKKEEDLRCARKWKRRIPWGARPCEISAERQTRAALGRVSKRRDEAILALALWLDEQPRQTWGNY